MPAAEEDLTRRSVVPQAAGRSLWLAAVWTGVGAAIVCATAAIVAVAIVWLPVSGPDSSSMSAVRAGLLTFLAALHGGITVDGTPAAFLPLGLTVIVGLTAWRAGSGLGDAADSIDERDPARLAVAGGVQIASFAVAALIMIPFAHLGTSSAPYVGVAGAALVLFTVTGGVAFVRSSALADHVAAWLPVIVGRAARLAAVAVAVYVGAGALLVAVSLVAHHADVEALSRQVGGGWAGLPVLLLGAFAAPNAAIAGASYLAGPGFTVGAGTTATPFTAAHGTVPAFPILGALPHGSGANPAVWILVVVTPLVAGGCVAVLAWRIDAWRDRLIAAGAGIIVAGVAMIVLGWQGGGSIGSGGLRTVGASPGWFALAVMGELTAVVSVSLAGAAGWVWLRTRHDDVGPSVEPSADAESTDAESTARSLARRLFVIASGRDDDSDEGDQLAG